MKNIQSLTFWIVLITGIAALSGCTNNSSQQVITGRLIALDAQLDSVPQMVLDSLRTISTRRLSSFNKGHSDKLQTIAEDKNGVDFTSGSQINESVKILYKQKKKYPNLYARSLMYLGVVRYRRNYR